MRLIALDLSKHGCGLASGDGSKPPRTSVEGFPCHSRGATGAAFRRWLRGHILNYEPEMIIYESIIAQRIPHNSEETVRQMEGLAFLTETICAEARILVRTVACSSWRKTFLGHGYPSDAKKAAMLMCDQLQWPHGDSHDRAEAAGIWCHGHMTEGNRRAMHKMLSHGSVRAMA